MPATEAARLAGWRARCEHTLDALLPAADAAPERLHAAMRHAVLGAGKRLRPLLVYAAGTAFGAEDAALDAPAAAVELIHAYSLVHDDLPAMDDDALRRGQPTVHVAFDEANAILAGDALQCLAFEVLSAAALPEALRVALLRSLAQASGSRGMAGGQALDLAAVGGSMDTAALERMHGWKTGALIRAAVRMGALVGGAGETALQALDRFAAALGLAFQIRDDLLDVESDAATLGKTAGKDARDGKPTYVSVLGLDGARAALERQVAGMDAALQDLGAGCSALRALGRMAAQRSH